MEKVDFKKQLKYLYAPSAKNLALVDVPVMRFIKIDGAGGPVGEAYQVALKWLYSLSYTLKFMAKLDLQRDYVVPPLEGLWWAHDMSTFVTRQKHLWLWTMMIMQPDWISDAMYDLAFFKVAKELGAPPETLRFEDFDEGLSVQILHIGSYDDEGPTIAEMHDVFLPKRKLTENGHHHEIYLSDPRRVQPEKLRTVLRQPVCALAQVSDAEQ